MDKYEYNLKLEEIDKLVDQGDYEEAANLADTIEWRRVRNVRTLSLMSEIYEAAGKLEKSKDMLVRAYRRSPVGRNVLYRLVEVTTALGEYDEALEYYAEYVQAAPHDNNRYILKYKIYRGRGSSTEELIAILEEYLGLEYTERWAYELALLYQEAGQIQKCMATCDDLVLWFHSGKYVRKALDLKKRYAVLTPKQKQIYEVCLQEEAQDDYFDDAEEDATVLQKKDGADDEVLAENIIAETEKEIAGEITARKAEREKESREQAQVQADASSGSPEAERPPADGKEQSGLFAKVFRKGAAKPAKKNAESPSVSPRTNQEVQNGETGYDEVLEEEGELPPSAYEEPAMPDPPEYDDLQVEMAKSVRKVISGVVRKPELNEEDVPAAVEERLHNIQEVSRRVEPEPVAGKLSIDDILLAMGEKGKQAAAAARAQREAAASQDEADVRETAPEAASALQDEADVREAAPEAASASQDKADVRETAPEAVPASQDEADVREAAPQDVAASQDEADVREAAPQDAAASQDKTDVQGTANTECEAETVSEDTGGIAGETRTESGNLAGTVSEETEEISVPEDTENSKTPENSDETLSMNIEALVGQEVAEIAKRKASAAAAGELTKEQLEALRYSNNPEKFLKNRASLPTYMSDRDAGAQNPDEKTVKINDNNTGEDAGATRRFNTKEELLEAARQEIMTSKTIRIPAEEVAKAYAHRTDEPREKAPVPQDTAPSKEPVQETEILKDSVQDMNDSEPAAPEMSEEEEYFDDPLTLAPYHRDMFAGFTEVDGLEDQIANAILQAMAKGNDRTSRTGNILIFGAHGSGKTTLATNIAKAIAQEKGRQTVKMAKIYAADLNRRDIAATVAKIAGGTLIVEEAGDLADDTVEQLTTAMEFRTDGLIVILEDEQRYLHSLLMNHPRFTMKFTAQIYLPAYTVDELCMFALRHANALDYSISEDGFDVIRQKVAQMSSTETPMSIGDIVAMVDQAIRHSNKFMRKMSMGKKRYDENDYVLLFAKDFK